VQKHEKTEKKSITLQSLSTQGGNARIVLLGGNERDQGTELLITGISQRGRRGEALHLPKKRKKRKEFR